jgi:hypothetical protein
MVGDQMLLETARTLHKLSDHQTGAYLMRNIYKNGTFEIQKRVALESVNFHRKAQLNLNRST